MLCFKLLVRMFFTGLPSVNFLVRKTYFFCVTVLFIIFQTLSTNANSPRFRIVSFSIFCFLTSFFKEFDLKLSKREKPFFFKTKLFATFIFKFITDLISELLISSLLILFCLSEQLSCMLIPFALNVSSIIYYVIYIFI